jgi:hypothetical protein
MDAFAKQNPIEISVRLWRGLQCIEGAMDQEGNIGFEVLEQLSEGDILRIPSFGRKSLNELKSIMADYRISGLQRTYKEFVPQISPKEQERRKNILKRNLEMFWHHSNGMKIKDIAALYSLSNGHVSIQLRKMWSKYISRFEDEKALRFSYIKEAKEIYEGIGTFQ